MTEPDADLHVRAEQWLQALDEIVLNSQDFPDEAEVFLRQRDTLRDLLQEGRDWRKVFGHLGRDPDTAGNLINGKMNTLEQEVRRLTVLLVDERLALRTAEQEVRDLRANRDLFKATAELYERQYQQDIQPQLAAAEAEVRDLRASRDAYRSAAAQMHDGIVGAGMAGMYNAVRVEDGIRLFDEAEAARGIGHPEDLVEIASYKGKLEAAEAHQEAQTTRVQELEAAVALHWEQGNSEQRSRMRAEAKVQELERDREAQITALNQMEEKYYRVVFRLHVTTVEHGGSVIGSCDQWPCRELPRQHPAMLWGPPDADPDECALCCEPAAHPDHVLVDALSVHPTTQVTALRQLQAFALWVLDGYRTGDVGDIDGGDLQEKALELGLLVGGTAEGDPNFYVSDALSVHPITPQETKA